MTAVIMNRPSLDRFEDKVKPRGTLVLNSSMVDRLPRRNDVEVLQMPVNMIADQLGTPRVANMVLLGAFVEKQQLLDIDRGPGIPGSSV